MKIRRFYGSNLRSALRQVTEEFGNDAAILSNKKVPGGIEVIAALDYDAALIATTPVTDSKRSENNSLSESTQAQGMNQQQRHLTDSDMSHHATQPQGNSSNYDLSQGKQGYHQSQSSFPPDEGRQAIQSNYVSENNFDDELEARLQQSESVKVNLAQENIPSIQDNSEQARMVGNIARKAQKPIPQTTEKLSRSHASKIEWSLDPSLQAMREELSLMRAMMSEQLKGIAWNQFSDSHPVSAMVTRRLNNMGIDKDIINVLAPKVDKQQDSECAWQKILAIFAKALPVQQSELLEVGGIYAFMGPTGVGKTTTIAKLAARYVLKHGANSVALITTDNYRISAQEQLATFGKILQLPTTKVSGSEGLENALKKYADKKLILIDSAGISGADHHLSEPLQSIHRCRKPIKKFLLMSAASQSLVLQQSVKLFSPYKPDGIIITKLDEATSLGEILSVIKKSRIPVTFATDGQRIPEDITQAQSHQLVSKAVWLANKYRRTTDEWELAQSSGQVKNAS